MTQRIESKYTVTRVIKASALLPDTRTLFEHWDENRSVKENIQMAASRNIFGKSSRVRVSDILKVFEARYLRSNGTANAIQRLLDSPLPAEITDRVLYYYTALAEPILYDFVTETLYDLYQRGRQVISKEDALDFIRDAVRDGKTEGQWDSPITVNRVAVGLLSTLRDFRILNGQKGSTKPKPFAPVHLPVEAFVFIAFDMKKDGLSGARLIHHPNWRLFLLKLSDVERLFIEAHQLNYLRYEAAGSLVRLEFPYEDQLDVAEAIINKWQRLNYRRA